MFSVKTMSTVKTGNTVSGYKYRQVYSYFFAGCSWFIKHDSKICSKQIFHGIFFCISYLLIKFWVNGINFGDLDFASTPDGIRF